jgi:EAL domain-containing protein (putative c-di-GMP-specific phosphodiesterase class I)/CheY-like chemotaxis protein
VSIKRICIIDDDPNILHIVSKYAEHLGLAVYSVSTWSDIELSQLKSAELIILDLSLPDFDGLDIIDHLAQEKLITPILLCSGHDENVIEAAADVLKTNGLSYAGNLIKPFSFKQFNQMIESHSLAGLPTNVPIFIKAVPREDVWDAKRLSEALALNQFSLCYQPQIYSHTGKLHGVECLARLHTLEHKMVMPDYFIPALDKHGLMDDFTLYIIELGLSQLEKLDLPSATKIAFNISATSIHEDFLLRLLACCEKHQINNSDIVLELTETSTLSMTQDSKKILTKLRLKGFNLSLDDFGTGYATFQEIDSMPFNQIKVDKTFVQSMQHKKSSEVIVSTTIDLAAKLNFTLVAEGVETQQQAEALSGLKCPVVQGYLFARPLSLKDLILFLKRNDNLFLSGATA